MDHRSEIWATRNERLEALKARYVPTPDNQQQFGDGDLNKIMDHYLYEATKEGDVEEFISALENVSKLRKLALSLIFEQVASSRNSLLHVAASSGKDDLIELILDHFPYLVIRKNFSEDTPLHVAVRNGSLKAIEMLIHRRTNLEIKYWKNKDGKSPLYLAVEICKICDSNPEGVGWRILELLVREFARDEAYAVKIEGMSPVLATDKNGSHPIHIACEGSSSSTFETLLDDTWPDLADIKNNKRQNILHIATMAKNDHMVQKTLKARSKRVIIEKLVNSEDVDGNTPLHLASMHNPCNVMRPLTSDKRSDLQLVNNDGLTALDVAMESGSLSMKNPALLGRAILIVAGVRRSKGRDVLSPREERAGASKSSPAEWIKDQVNTLLVVAMLVASVTFTACVTLPGGYNASGDPHPGTATILHKGAFQVFVIANTLAMYSSILAVVVLLWGLSRDFYVAELAYHSTGPLLLMALAGMSVAFFAAITVAVSKLTWLGSIVLSVGVLYLTMFIGVLAALIFPSS